MGGFCVKILQVSDFALHSYRFFVKGNFSLGATEVSKKLTRNILLGVRIGEIDGTTWYAYGQMRILVKNDKVTCVMNHNEVLDGWELDLYKKEILNNILGIA